MKKHTVSVQAVARQLGVTDRTARRYAARNVLGPAQTKGKTRFFDMPAVRRFQENEERTQFLSQVITEYLRRQPIVAQYEDAKNQRDSLATNTLRLRLLAQLDVVFPATLGLYWKYRKDAASPVMKQNTAALSGTLRPWSSVRCGLPARIPGNTSQQVKAFARRFVNATAAARQRRRFGIDEADFLAALFVCAEWPPFPKLPRGWEKSIQRIPRKVQDRAADKEENEVLGFYLSGRMRRTAAQKRAGVVPHDFATVRGSQLHAQYIQRQGRNHPTKTEIAKTLGISRVQSAELWRRIQTALSVSDMQQLEMFLGGKFSRLHDTKTHIIQAQPVKMDMLSTTRSRLKDYQHGPQEKHNEHELEAIERNGNTCPGCDKVFNEDDLPDTCPECGTNLIFIARE